MENRKKRLNQKQLIEASRNGDNSAFKELVNMLEPQVASTVIGMLGDCQEADDVGQETFIRFYRSLGNFRGDASVETYITRIAINLSLNELKRRKRRAILFTFKINTDSKEIPLVNPDHEQYEIKTLIQRAIRKLAPAFRSVVVLRLIDGYSTKETAEILEIPAGTVLSRLARAQQKLKIILQPVMGDLV